MRLTPLVAADSVYGRPIYFLFRPSGLSAVADGIVTAVGHRAPAYSGWLATRRLLVAKIAPPPVCSGQVDGDEVIDRPDKIRVDLPVSALHTVLD